MLAQAPTPEQRYASGHEAGSFLGSAATVNYEEGSAAGFINENGEWEFTVQTSPELAERGMHEVNTSDNAYDKYVRLERSAKWTGGLTAPAADPIPESKWARLWQPIKKFFSSDEKEKNTLSPSKTDTNKPFALASASTGLGKVRDTKQAGRYSRASLNMGPNANFNAITADPAAIYNLTNPEIVFTHSAEQLKETASQILDPQRAKQVIETIDNEKKIAMKKAFQRIDNNIKADFNEKLAAEKDLNAPSVNLVEKMFSKSCDEKLSFSGFYDANPTQSIGHPTCSNRENDDDPQVKEKQMELHRELMSALNIDIEKPISLTTNLVVLLDKTTAGQQLDFLQDNAPQNQPAPTEQSEGFTSQAPLSAAKEFVKIVYKMKGCDKHDCYWVANTQTNLAQDLVGTVHESGLLLQSDPMGTIDLNQLQVELAATNFNDITQLNAGEFPVYFPYTKEEMMKLNERNKPVKAEDGTLTASKDSFMFFVPSATKANEMKEVLPNLAHVIYDSPAQNAPKRSETSSGGNPALYTYTSNPDMLAGPILNAKELGSNEARGQQLRQEFINRAAQNFDITREELQIFKQKATKAVVQAATDQEIEKIKKEGPFAGLATFDFHQDSYHK